MFYWRNIHLTKFRDLNTWFQYQQQNQKNQIENRNCMVVHKENSQRKIKGNKNEIYSFYYFNMHPLVQIFIMFSTGFLTNSVLNFYKLPK